MEKVCQRCGIGFDGTQNAKWCCECRPIVNCEQAKESRIRQSVVGIEIVVPEYKACGHCKETKPASEFSPQRDRRDGLSGWCKSCRNQWSRELRKKKPKQPKKIKPCAICGNESLTKYCSRECELENKRRKSLVYYAAKKELIERICKECGEKFTPEYRNKRRRFCSDRCLRKYLRRKRTRWCAKNFNAANRKRLRLYHGSEWQDYYEPINRKTVFEGDNWRCRICGNHVSESRIWDPLQATIDHIIPISRGGKHTYANVQTACMKCNSAKRDVVD